MFLQLCGMQQTRGNLGLGLEKPLLLQGRYANSHQYIKQASAGLAAPCQSFYCCTEPEFLLLHGH